MLVCMLSSARDEAVCCYQYINAHLTAAKISASISRVSAAGKGGSNEAEGSMTRCCVEVSISLRALVPNMSAASAAIAIRMAERWNRYEQYTSFWQVRPRVSSSVLTRASYNCLHSCEPAGHGDDFPHAKISLDEAEQPPVCLH